MKIICFLLLFIPVSLIAQSFWVADTVALTYAKEKYFPKKIKEKRWMFEYNEKGKTTKTIYQEMGAEDTILRNKWEQTFSYDEKDSLAIQTVYNWKDTHFIPLIQLTYDWNTKSTEKLYQCWKDSTWKDDNKTIYTYNRKGKLKNKLVFSHRDILWEKSQETSYSYFLNRKKGTIRFFFDKRRKYDRLISTYNKHRLIKKEITKKYSYYDHVARSVNKSKKTWKYNKNNLISLTKETYYKKVYNYDTNNNLIEIIIHSKLDTLCGKYTYQYDGENNRISALVQKGKNLEWENSQCFIYKYANNNAVFGECKIWENNQWVDGNRKMEIFHNNGELLFDEPDFEYCHQFKCSYKEIKINNE